MSGSALLGPAALGTLIGHAAIGVLFGLAVFVALHRATMRLLRGEAGPWRWLGGQGLRLGAVAAAGLAAAAQGAGALLALATGLWLGRAVAMVIAGKAAARR